MIYSRRTMPCLANFRTFMFFIFLLCGFILAESEKDFEFIDSDIKLKKRSVDNTLQDDEDVLQNDASGDGSGTEPPQYPAFYRVTINFTDLTYSDALRDRESTAFQTLADSVGKAIENLFRSIQGQQDIVVVQFSPGSLLVTFDLGTQGFYDRDVLYNVLNTAVNQGSIPPYRVSPLSFSFRALSDGVSCPNFVGREPAALPRSGDNRANLLVNNIFPCRGYVVGWRYYRVIPRYNGFVGVFRQISDYQFVMIGKTELRVDTVGNHTVYADPPILAEKDDFIGIFYPRTAEEGVVGGATAEDVSSAELYENYLTRVFDDQIEPGVTVDILPLPYQETRSTFAIQALMDYTNIGEVTSPPAKRCDADQFTCANGECILAIYECDGQVDCYDGSDEKNCARVTCGDNEFSCLSGQQCIAAAFVCNGQEECFDGSDESNCPVRACTDNEFRCTDGSCIDKAYQCDSRADCPDGSDEYGCPSQPSCQPDEFTCNDGNCVERGYVCDGFPDCKDQSDEQNCTATAAPICPEGLYRCDDGECVVGRDCNGIIECRDRSDEDPVRCGTAVTLSIVNPQLVLNTGETAVFECVVSGNARVSITWSRETSGSLPAKATVSNGRLIVPSVTIEDADTYVCSAPSIPGTRSVNAELLVIPRPGECPGQYACDDDTCVPAGSDCNGRADCPDGSDEFPRYCGCPVVRPFMCADGRRCIDKMQECNGIVDCLDSSDEHVNCSLCRDDEFRCRDTTCIPLVQECDRVRDCPDGSDEIDCPPIQCPPGDFKCADDLQCIDARLQCDGYADCNDGSDERNCAVTCSSTQFTCGDGQCIDIRRQCDGVRDCDDASDEARCPSRPCTSREFTCRDGSCIDARRRCDGRSDCLDGYDEENCKRECRQDEFRCANGDCIPAAMRCDRRPQCEDSSDELNCQCRQDEFRCANGDCIPAAMRCDRRPQCEDSSDEANCPTCRQGEFLCDGRRCIDERRVCDRRFDCSDRTDEANCPTPTERPIVVTAQPGSITLREGREAVFQCVATGAPGAQIPPVRWSRGGNIGIPLKASDERGRLTIPDLRVEDSGTYVCSAVGVQGSYEARVQLQVRSIGPTSSPPVGPCGAGEAVCQNGQCIPSDFRCDGEQDCSDGSDEINCSTDSPCEPNEFRCNNGLCAMKIWRCDGDRDCTDGSDELNCPTRRPGDPCEPDEYQCTSGDQCIPASYQCDDEIDCQDRSDEIGCSVPVINIPPVPNIEVEIGGQFTIICEAVGTPTPLIVWRLNWGNIPTGDRIYVTSVNGRGNLTVTDARITDSGAYTCEAINTKGAIFAIPDAIVIVRRSSTGQVCKPPFFNVEASITSQCVRCFCFGQTTECFSSNLQITQISLVGQIQLVNQETSVPIEQTYVQLLPSRDYQVVDFNRVVPQGNYYYWSLPREFLGNRLSSYGGNLTYRIYYEITGREIPTNQPDVIITGNGITLYHRTQTFIRPGTPITITAPLFPDGWRRSDGPDRGDTPVTEYASREDLMMVLENLESIYIRSQYDNRQVLTRIGQVVLTTGVAEDIGGRRAVFVEECSCPPGYTGLSCQDCALGYRRIQRGPYLGVCQRCDCNGHSSDCDPETGRCRFCQHNTGGNRCQDCLRGYYGDATQGTPGDCKPCPCPLTRQPNQFSPTCRLDTDGQPTCTACPQGYVGRRCERCAPDYIGNPQVLGDFCRPLELEDRCDSRGSLSRQPDPQTGRCACKQNVQGETCDRCKPNTFYLNVNNPYGCIRCFCMGVTETCTSTSWNRAQIGASFTRDRLGFTLTDVARRIDPITSGFSVNSNVRELIYRNFGDAVSTYYWSLPSRFLGDKVMSYGGTLRFVLTYRPGRDSSPSDVNAPLVQIVGNDITLVYRDNTSPRPNTPVPYNVPLYEQSWTRLDGEQATREFLLMALADLEAVLIRATFTQDTDQASIRDVIMDIAENRETGQDRAYAVEQCVCPRGYRGLSCEDCDTGYTRSGGGLYLGLCEPCSCNGHSSECDPETGRCRNCQHNTEGDRCERCATGYYGDPTRGTPNDCQPCPCPLTEAPNQFSPTCRLDSDGQVTCTACPAGHTGRRCESCIQGYFGNPLRPGDYCKIRTGPACDCDARGTVPNTQCDPNTLQCQCKANVQGLRCNTCKEGYFYLDESNSQGCLACYCMGITGQCTSSSYYRDVVRPQLGDDGSHNFVLTNRRLNNVVQDGFEINADRNEVTFNQFTGVQRERESLFFSLPPKFRGNKVSSYGGYLRFTIEITESALGSPFRDVDLEIISSGQRQRMYYLFNPPLTSEGPQTYEILLRETSFRGLDGQQPTRQRFMTVLSDIEAILIRATYYTAMSSVTLRNVEMDIAVPTPTGLGRTPMVESCRCPEGYTGLSCEQCAPGYLRTEDAGTALGRCVRCNCNGHSSTCDPITGQCLNCQHNTEGDRCERCVAGYYGDSTVGTPNDCRPCPCPLTIPSNQFSRTCFLDTDRQVTCDRCPTGYIGRDCGRCDRERGYEGNPRQPGGSCQLETVNLRPVVEVTPTRIEIPPRQIVNVRCDVRGQGPFNVVWTRVDGRQLPARASVSPRYVLTIRDVERSDSGRYTCTATNIHGSTREYVTITVTGEEQPIRVRIEEPTEISVEEGVSVRFVCTASGSREMTYILSWTRQGGSLPLKAIDNNGILIIPNVRPEDSGNYICTGSDMFSTDTAVATLTVSGITPNQTPPQVRIEPRYQTVVEGTRVEFRCIATGNPQPRVEWRRRVGQISSLATIRDGVLTFPAVSRSDESEYFCRATNSAGTSEIRTILYVTPSKPTIQVIVRQTSVIAVVGSTVQLVCYVEDDTRQPVLVWSRREGLPPGSSQEAGTLTITNIQPSYAGRYICTATTPEGDTGSGTTDVTVSPEPPGERPSVTVTPNNVTFAMGTTGTLRCAVTGRPTPRITWTKSGSEELSSRHRVDGELLRIVNVQMEDRGIYVCRAENSAGLAQGWSYVEVKRRMRPKIDLYPSGTQTIAVGASALFQCRVMDGDPRPTVRWTRAGGEPMTSTTETMENGVLMFKGVTGDEAGAYVCTATNEIGSTTATATLTIQGPPRITIQPSRTVYAVVGQRVSVECIAEGQPTPSVVWRTDRPPSRGDIPIGTEDEFALATPGSATLIIESIQTTDSGSYTCLARNVGGTSQDTVQVIVRDETPDTVGVSITGPSTLSVVEGQRVELQCNTQGLTNAQVTWRRRNGRLPPNHSIRDGRLIIPSFRSEYSGEYICSASTPQRNYEASVFIIVTVTPSLTIAPGRVEARAGQTVSLQCIPQGTGPFNIEWTKVNGGLSPLAIQHTDGTLEIRQVTATDAGRYRCMATSSAGSSDGFAIVDVQVPPTIVASQRDQRSRLGEVLSLRCQATGSPYPEISWEKEGGDLPLQHTVQDGVLTIYNVQSRDQGRYICTARSASGVDRDYINLRLDRGGTGTDEPVIKIDTQTVNAGERVEMECVVTGTPTPLVTWSKLEDDLPIQASINDVYLVIPSVKPEDAGTYVCTAENIVGTVQQRVNLFVRARPVITGQADTLTAALGSSASLACDAQGYPRPQITWYKRDGQMPREYSVEDGELQIPRVRPEDAGMYVCNAENTMGRNEHGMNLVVGDLVPYFNQNPSSYISYPPMNDVYLDFDILLSLKPETTEGLVLYSSQYDSPSGDFLCFGLREGYPEFRFDVGAGPAIIQGNRTMELDRWHTVKLKRERTRGSMVINDEAEYSGVAPGSFQGLDVQEKTYLGGVPDYTRIPDAAGFSSGFVGSVSQLRIKDADLNLGGDAYEMHNVEPYNSCYQRPCLNGGRCIPSNTAYGYECICPQGYAGSRCEIQGERCYQGACGRDGRCHDLEGGSGYMCICPLGRVGAGCQSDVLIVNPMFNVSSFVSYPQVRSARFDISIEIEFKPQTLEDGVILYSGQREDGSGDYFALAIKNGYLEFRYNTGSGPAILRSRNVLRAGEWTKVTATKVGQEGTLIVNAGEPVKVYPWSYYTNKYHNYYNYYLRRRYRYRRGTSPGSTIGLDIKTRLYVGGVDPGMTLPSELGINKGFVGCVAELQINLQPIDLLNDAIESANVMDCGERNICNRRPCRNGGTCERLSATDYHCLCTSSFTGKNCEAELNLCRTQNPCANRGVCKIIQDGYRCDCPLGYGGNNCEATTQLGESVEFDRNGYVEFSRDFLPHSQGQVKEVIRLTIRTRESEGLLFWHGQSQPEERLQGGDYVALALRNGIVEFSYELGSGAAEIRSTRRVDDGYTHNITATRLGKDGRLVIDNNESEGVDGASAGILQMLNAEGNIYIGGVPHPESMTGRKYTQNFKGCVSDIYLQDKGPLRVPDDAAGGYNVRRCFR